MRRILPLIIGLLILLPVPLPAAPPCGPPLLIQAPLPNRAYRGPTLLEGDVYGADVTVTVTVDGVKQPVTIRTMNPGRSQFYRWEAGKYRIPGTHTAVITASNRTAATVETVEFQVIIAERR